MNEAMARAMIEDHFERSNISVAGGGPADDIARASGIYADDAVLEWPQGGERVRGKANIIAVRSAYPARQEFELHRTTGCHDLWINEYTIRYDDRPMNVVGIMEFRDGKVARERIYFGEPWEPPAWRAQWVEPIEEARNGPEFVSSHQEDFMTTKTTNLFLPEDLRDVGRTSELAESDLEALRAVADWIETFVAKPHEDLGRAGPVCPFVPGGLERKTLWLAPEPIAHLGVPEVVELMSGYKRLFLDTPPVDGSDVDYKVIVVVFTDLPTDRAQGVFHAVLEQLAVPSYVEDGILFGPFYKGNEGTAIYNSGFRPFQSPVPFLFVRQGVISDWKFFLDDEGWLALWAHRYGESGSRALAEELRRLPWRGEVSGAFRSLRQKGSAG